MNAAGLVQGVALVTFPAASTIFTAQGSYDLSRSEYGLMFVPQVVTAIAASLLGAGVLWPGLTRRVSEKALLLAGLLADLASMVLLIVSWLVVHQHAAAFTLLLVATACLGAGFGLCVPGAEHPGRGVPPGGGGQVRAGPERTAGSGHGARAAVRGRVQRDRVLGRAAGAGRLPAGRADRAQPAVAAGPWPFVVALVSSGGGFDAPGGVLGVRGVRGPVRILRDHERQLVATGRHVAGGASRPSPRSR